MGSSKKAVIVLVAFLVVGVLAASVLSGAFITVKHLCHSHEAVHSETCMACTVVAGRKSTEGLSSGLSSSFDFSILFFLIAIISFVVCFISARSLISQKVRLDC